MICTSRVERLNLDVRKKMRRLTRLTNAFSKKFENLRAAFALFVMHHNFVRIHGSLRWTGVPGLRLADLAALPRS